MLDVLIKRIKEINALLESKKAIWNLVKEDLESVSKEFGDVRKSKLVKKSAHSFSIYFLFI